MRVAELREELAKRGLSTSGLKPALVKVSLPSFLSLRNTRTSSFLFTNFEKITHSMFLHFNRG